MARMWLMGLVLATTGLGCRTFDTNRTMRGSPAVDTQGNSIEEQERRGRARWGIGEDDFRVGPKTYADRPDPVSGGY